MKKLNLIPIAMIILIAISCKKDIKPIYSLIDIKKWDEVTIKSIKNNFNIDSILIYGDGTNIPIKVQNGKEVYSFDEQIRIMLSFREKELKALQTFNYLSDEKTIYIEEFQGFTTNGFMKNFFIYNINCPEYYFTYNVDNDTFTSEKGRDSTYYSDETIFHSDVYMRSLVGYRITTKISRNNKNELTYDIIRICLK